MRYLALGDSYTIGELVPTAENFPHQVCERMRVSYPDFELANLIATTGWTTDELAVALEKNRPDLTHDWVTLLIGVNNQYRGRDPEEYRWQFYSLLCQSILYAGGRPQRTIVLSIPDWGLTPFNKERDAVITSGEIDQYNAINANTSDAMGVHYLDVTTSSRHHAKTEEYLAPDLLHYSGKEYGLWADLVYNCMQQQLTKEAK